MIYLDNSATTEPNNEVLESFIKVSKAFFANPSSIHQLGGEVEQLQFKAREQAANLLGIDEKEVVFTSGGTEGNNLARSEERRVGKECSECSGVSHNKRKYN